MLRSFELMVSIVCVDDFAATILIMSCCYLYADAFLCIFTSRIPNGNCDKYVVGTPFGQVIVTRPQKERLLMTTAFYVIQPHTAQTEPFM